MATRKAVPLAAMVAQPVPVKEPEATPVEPEATPVVLETEAASGSELPQDGIEGAGEGDGLGGTPEELEDDADDGLVEVTTLGEPGSSRVLCVNGVATPISCGIVMRVTPEMAAQFKQCSLI